jgi:hypothetical protein
VPDPLIVLQRALDGDAAERAVKVQVRKQSAQFAFLPPAIRPELCFLTVANVDDDRCIKDGPDLVIDWERQPDPWFIWAHPSLPEPPATQCDTPGCEVWYA